MMTGRTVTRIVFAASAIVFGIWLSTMSEGLL